MQLNNTIKDLRSGLSSQFGGIVVAPPTIAKLPTVTSDTLLGRNEINRGIKVPVVDTDVRDLANKVEATRGTPVDAAPMGAVGDYPPPQGVQGGGMSKMLLYGGLAVAVALTAYFLYKKKN